MNEQSASVAASIAVDSLIVGLAWPILVGTILWASWPVVREVLSNLALRIKSGARIVTPWLQVDAVNVSTHANLTELNGITSRHGEPDLEKARQAYREGSRDLFLVHRLLVSEKPGQLYDILIYLIPHRENPAFSQVAHVEYYFGPYWRGRVYVSSNPRNNFAVAISSYGPSLCMATVAFKDGRTSTIFRYLDFEMGPLPLSRLREQKGSEESGAPVPAGKPR